MKRNLHKYYFKISFFILILNFSVSIIGFSQTSPALINITKINKLNGVPNIVNGGNFGWDCDTLGDLNGDGTMDYAIGAPYSNTGSAYSGMIHILFMNPNKTVKYSTIISRNSTNVNIPNGPGYDLIGITICNIGDFNNDGTDDVAIGMQNNNQVSLLMLDTNGSVKTTFNLNTSLTGYFGSDIINLGDTDNDGVTDLMVCGYHDGIYIVKLNSNGTIKSLNQIISSPSLGYTINGSDNFPSAIRMIGDLDGNGINEIVATAPAHDNSKGEIAILYFNAGYTLKSIKKISSGSPSFTTLNNGDNFGHEIQNAGDLDNDGIIDIFVGAPGDDFGGPNSNNYGAVYGICINNFGGVKSYFKLDKGNCILNTRLQIGDYFGMGISNLGDVDNDNIADLLMSSYRADEGGTDNGSIYIFSFGNRVGNNSSTIDTSFCKGENINLNMDTIFNSYLWNTGDTTSSIIVNTTGTFICNLTDDAGCVFNDTINVNELNPPIQHALKSVELCEGSVFNYGLQGDAYYLWWDGSTNQNHLISDSGIYWVNIYNQCDSVTDSIHITYKDCNCNITIPNVFTPNSDGINETFSPIFECEFKHYQLTIFNRWGKLIFNSNNPNTPWDGKYLGVKVPDGVYFYIFTYENIFENEQKTLTGSVTIFR